MRVTICQLNPTVGDLAGNLKMIQNAILEHQNQSDVIVFSELVTVGYPPKDLLYSRELWDNHPRVIQAIHSQVKSYYDHRLTVILGGLNKVELSHGRVKKYNSAFIIDRDRVRVVNKRLLPCYDIFQENRYFDSGLDDPYLPIPITFDFNKTAITQNCDVVICEDMWNYQNVDKNPMLPASYTEDPISKLTGVGPIFIINGSPYWQGKFADTKRSVERICKGTNRPVVWSNQVGAHDDIVTAGYSMVFSPTKQGNASYRIGKFFQEDAFTVWLSPYGRFDSGFHSFHDIDYDDQDKNDPDHRCIVPKFMLNGEVVDKSEEQDWFNLQAMMLHLKDYTRRTGFKKVVLGQSGGIDSALVAAIASLALGPTNVISVTMPSKYSSGGSVADSKILAENLGIKDFRNISISGMYDSLRGTLLSGGKQEFDKSLTDENIQPRIRMMILMAISSEEDALLLTTGNKSELALGYYTLYGDGAGGLAVISDIYKTMVRSICRLLNRYYPTTGGFIPVNTIEKPPSAELAPNQVDTDSLPPYELLDPTLDDLLNEDMTIEDVMRRSKIPDKVQGLKKRIAINEFKRKQSPVSGAKITKRAFGSGRLMPVVKKVTFV